MSTNTNVVQFVQQAAEDTLQELAEQPNLRFLKIFPRKGNLTRAKVVNAFQEVFEQIGGVSRFALWSDSHPDEFYKLYARLLPPSGHPDLDGNTEWRVVHVLPPTALDQVQEP